MSVSCYTETHHPSTSNFLVYTLHSPERVGITPSENEKPMVEMARGQKTGMGMEMGVVGAVERCCVVAVRDKKKKMLY